jgi:TonB family protein
MNLERREQSGAGMAAGHLISCGRCGAVIKPGKRFCSTCGCPAGAAVVSPPAKHARKPSVCPECSFENHHSDLFCKGCGAQLADLPAALSGRNFVQQAAITPPRPEEKVVKTQAIEPPAVNQQPADLETDIGNAVFMPAAIAAPPLTVDRRDMSGEWPAASDEQGSSSGPQGTSASDTAAREEFAEAADILRSNDTEPPIHQPLNSEANVASPFVNPRAMRSGVSTDEAAARLSFPNAQATRPKRAGARALGVAAVGVGLVVAVALPHFRRPARAQAKQIPMAAAALVTRPASPSPAAPVARTNPADQRLRSVNLASAGDHRQGRSGRSQAIPASRQKNLENTNQESAKADVPKLPPTASAPPVMTAASSQPESQPSSGLRPLPASIHSETEKQAPPAASAVAPQTPAAPVEVSRQIPPALPATSSTPSNLPPKTDPGLVSPAAPAAPSTTAERAPAVQPAKLASRPALHYPALAFGARVQGDVQLEANVRADGTVAGVRVVKGVVMLNDAAVELVQNSRYQPALVDGRPVRSYVDVTISFRLPH